MIRFVCMLIACSMGISLAASPVTNDASQAEGKEVLKVKITEGQIDVISGVVYSQTPSLRANRALKMTLLIPRTKELKPAVVFYPGGGFTSAAHERYFEMRMALAKAGFVVAAVRFLRAHAGELGIDASRIGVLGDSAGGYVAQMMGTTNGEKQFDQGDNLDQSSDVQAAVTIYGISNLMNIGEGYSKEIQDIHASPAVTEALLLYGPAFADFAGKSILSDPQKAMEASPMGHVKEGMPPFLIMHGSNDQLVSPVQSEQLYNELVKKGNKVNYIVVEGAGHGDLYWYQRPVIEKVVSWFEENLKDAGK